MSDDDFQVQLGRTRAARIKARPFVVVALAAAARAGGLAGPRAGRTSRFGRGRAAGVLAGHGLGRGARRVLVKARVVRHGPGRTSLGLHLDYLRREGVAQEAGPGRLFDAAGDEASGSGFANRCEGDRHHFRFIVSPEDADQLTDLRAFTRDLMRQAEHDLGTRLDWVAADHWNTAHPHVHVLVRGKDAAGQDLVISRDYISEGLRARAQKLVTLELGPRTEQALARALEREAGASRWTSLDRRLQQRVGEDGLIDLRPPAGRAASTFDRAAARRLAVLRDMGLADEVRPARWRVATDAEPTLKALGRQGDIIARLHEAMAASPDRDGLGQAAPIGEAPHGWRGRLIGRGLDDELRGSAYAVIDGVDGTVRHVPLNDLVNAADAPLGAIVEVRRTGAERGRAFAQLWVCSDAGLEAQTTAPGATWLDRQLVAGDSTGLGERGFGAAVREALDRRLAHLEARGLAENRGGRAVFARDLLQTLRAEELRTTQRALATETGLQPIDAAEGLSGVYRRRLDLTSGRFALVETEAGFALVPWRPSLERGLGQTIRAELRPGSGLRWTVDPARGLGR